MSHSASFVPISSDSAYGSSLLELLRILSAETGRDLSALTRRTGSMLQRQPLTEQDILNRPFYTVQQEEEQEEEVRHVPNNIFSFRPLRIGCRQLQ